MGLLRRVVESRAKLTLGNADQWFSTILRGLRTSSGVEVTEGTGLRFSAVWACVRVISEDVASLPLFVHERLTGGGKRRVTDHQLHPLLHDQPNPETTAMQLREAITAHLLGWGNAYLYVVTDNGGRPLELWPLPPSKTWPWRTSTGELTYWTEIPAGPGRPSPEPKLLRRDQVIHLAGLGFDGLVGYSPIRTHAEAIGAGLAAQSFGSRFFSQGTNLGGVVSHPGNLSDKAWERMKKDLPEKFQGLGREHLVLLLEEGMQYARVGIPPEEAQFVETRKFAVEEIARIYRVPPHKIGHLEKATFSNIEHQAIEYVTNTLRPWLMRWEQALAIKLLTQSERKRLFIGHVIEGMLRGDIATRYSAYAIARQWGWMSADDILELEDRNPLPEGHGKIYLQPLNMVPAGTVFGQDTEDEEEDVPDEERAAAYRRRLARAYRPIFAEADRRALRRERARVLEQARKRGADLERWLGTFYGEDQRSFLEERFAPAFASLGEAVVEAVAEEMGVGSETLRIGLPELVRSLSGAFAQRHAAVARDAVIEAARTGALESLFTRWLEERPSDTAERETQDAQEAFAQSARRSYEPAAPVVGGRVS